MRSRDPWASATFVIPTEDHVRAARNPIARGEALSRLPIKPMRHVPPHAAVFPNRPAIPRGVYVRPIKYRTIQSPLSALDFARIAKCLGGFIMIYVFVLLIGVVAAAQVVTDDNLIGKINVTGLALPSEFKQFIDNGASQAVALWNPIDLGYAAVMLANDLVEGGEAAPGATLSMGRMGDLTLDDTNSGAMAPPFTFDKSNIEEFSKIY
jgi:hypothetical protein